jgi:phosphoribosylformylglycinamidine synthase
MEQPIVHYYRKTEPSHSLLPSVREELKALELSDDAAKIERVETESCFNIQASASLTTDETRKLEWLLAETFEPSALSLEQSAFDNNNDNDKDGTTSWKVEFGPRMTFTSAFSSNAVSICQACGIPIVRLELSRRYRFVVSHSLSEAAMNTLKSMLHDRMTEQEYATPIASFDGGATAQPVRTIPIMTQGRSALEKINAEMGLGFDDHDLDYYTDLFKVHSHVQLYTALTLLR